MPPEDRVRVLHMLEAAEAIAAFIADRDRAALDADRMLLFALARLASLVFEVRPLSGGSGFVHSNAAFAIQATHEGATLISHSSIAVSPIGPFLPLV